MKKITLLIAAFVCAMAINAQEVISFESDEGYQLGSINGQVAWEADPENMFEITDEEAIDGEWSLKANEDVDGLLGPTDLGIALGDLGTTLMNDGVYTLSAQFHVEEEFLFTGSDDQFQIMLAGMGAGGLEPYAQGVIFGGDGGLFGVEDTGQGIAVYQELIAEGWNKFEVEIEVEGGTSTMTFKMNGNEIPGYSTEGPYEQTGGEISLLILGSSGGYEIYFDDIVIEDGPMSVDDHNFDSFTHYINNNELVLDAVSNQIDGVAIYNLLGQEVVNENINATSGSIALDALSAGVYVTKVSIDGQTKTFKFSKN